MKVTPIRLALPGERVVAVHPRMALQVDGKWRRRLNLYTGRTLSDLALHTEQHSRAGRLVTMGQAISPGVVTGLEIDLEPAGADTFLHVAPGVGIARSGEDVIIPHALRVDVADLFRDSETGEPQLPGPDGFAVRVLVLTPAFVRQDRREQSDDPCDVDETEDAYADERSTDACFLRAVPFPEDWVALPGDSRNFRNDLAYAIFRKEQAFGSEDMHPWEHLGVPLGLLMLSGASEGDTPFRRIDRYSVVRQGGRAKARTPLLSGQFRAGSPFLWQARIQQFAEQIADPMENRNDFFPQMPPAGMLPLSAITFVDRTYRGQRRFILNEILRSTRWKYAALPLPVEQLDQVIARAAGMTPFEDHDSTGDRDEEMVIIVPVPQSVYEPHLLTVEFVDDVFQETIDAAATERDRYRSLRFGVRRDYRVLVFVTRGPAAVPRYDDFNPEYAQDNLPPAPPDPDAMTGEDAVQLTPSEDRFGVEGGGTRVTDLSVPAWLQLAKELDEHGIFSKEEMKDLFQLGLEKFVEAIELKLGRADDTIDFSFLKSHPNIYRVRQLMLGATASTRLATSPVMATIAKGASASAVTSEINKFFLNVKGHKPPGTSPPIVSKPPAQTPVPSVRVSPAVFSRVTFFAAPATTTRMATLAPSSTIGAGSTAFPALGADGFKTSLKTAFGRSSIVLLPAASTRETVQQSTPIAGEGAYDFRTSSIAERIEDSPSREAKSYAVAARAEALEAIKLLHDEHMNVADIPVFGVPRLTTEGMTPIYERRYLVPSPKPGEDPDTDQPTEVLNPRFGMVKREPSVNFADLLKRTGGLSRVLRDPPGSNADEANLFSETVLIIEHAIATLRAVEGRIAAYRNELARCKAVLTQLLGFRGRAEKSLADLGDHVTEERHRVATATALLEDERARVDQVNDRRQQVLDKHVRFYAYVRPRALEALVDAPAVNLDPGAFVTPVPGCLAEHADAPVELEQMVQLLREAPVAWFAHVPRLLDRLDRVELLHGTLQVAKLRAVALRDADASPSTFVARALTGKLSVAIDKVTRAQQSVVTNFRYQVAQLDLARFAGMGWRESREEATRVLSLGDLIESNHGRSFVAEQAARELTQIGKIAACLYAQASEVLPAIRLEWADRLSQYDDAVTLRDLTALPRWGEVAYQDRRELQTLADWLYARIDGKHGEGTAWMHDLVRVCLLLASHAPINDIVAGSVPVDSQASPGRTVPITIDPRRVKLGMKVMFFKEQRLVAHGIVEDLIGGQARARIAETVEKELLLRATETRVQFADAEARTTPTFFRKTF